MADVRLRVTTENAKSIADLEKELKGLLAQFKGVPIASQQFKDLGGQVKVLRDNLGEAKKAAESSASAMMRSYFKTGEEIRRTALPSVIEFNRIIQDAPFGMMGMVNNVQRLSETFMVLQREVGGTGAGIKAMFSSMLTGPMSVMLAISVVTSLATIFRDKLFPAVEDTRKATDAYLESLVALGEMGKIERLGQTVKRMNELNQESAELAQKSAFWAAIAVLPGGGLAASLFGPKGGAAINAATEANKARAGVRGTFNTEMPTVGDQFVFGERPSGGVATSAGPFDSILRRWSANPQKVGLPSGGGGMQLSRASGSARQEVRATFDAMDSAWMGFASSVNAGVGAMSAQVSSRLGQAFSSVFGGAGTLLGSFVDAFTRALSDLAVKAAAIWAISKVPVIGPVVGAMYGLNGGGSASPNATQYSMPPVALSGGSAAPSLKVSISTTQLSVGLAGGNRIRGNRVIA